MTRHAERLIDVLVLAMLLVFGWAMREIQPALAGVITAAAVQFWLAKNAHPVLPLPERVEIVGQSEPVEVEVLDPDTGKAR